MIAAALLLAVTIPLSAPPPQPPQTIAAMRDRYRPLLIFSDTGMLQVQVDALKAHATELIERQVMLVPAYGGLGTILDPRIEVYLAAELSVLRRSFKVPAKGFTVILIGKDGGGKFRSHTPITIEQLIQLIDAMPMRRQEMRRQR